MLTSVWSVAVTVALGANPAVSMNGQYLPGMQAQPVSLSPQIIPTSGGPAYGGGYGYGAPGMSGEYAGGHETYGGEFGGYGGPMGGGTPGSLPSGAYPGYEPLYPYDTQLPWMHGYIQEMPSYGGFTYYRPYNYKHVMPQAQTAGGWGMSPTMPYSQQFWHRYKQQAAMSPSLSSYRSATPAAMARTPAASAVRGPMQSRPIPQQHVPVGFDKPADSSLPQVLPIETQQLPFQRYTRPSN